MQALEGHLHRPSLGIICSQALHKALDNAGAPVEVEDQGGLSRVRQVGKDKTDLSLHIIPVAPKQLQQSAHHLFSLKQRLSVLEAVCSDVGKDPADFSSDNCLLMVQQSFQGFENALLHDL